MNKSHRRFDGCAVSKIQKWACVIDAAKPICLECNLIAAENTLWEGIFISIAQPNYDSLKNGTISIACFIFLC